MECGYKLLSYSLGGARVTPSSPSARGYLPVVCHLDIVDGRHLLYLFNMTVLSYLHHHLGFGRVQHNPRLHRQKCCTFLQWNTPCFQNEDVQEANHESMNGLMVAITFQCNGIHCGRANKLNETRGDRGH